MHLKAILTLCAVGIGFCLPGFLIRNPSKNVERVLLLLALIGLACELVATVMTTSPVLNAIWSTMAHV